MGEAALPRECRGMGEAGLLLECCCMSEEVSTDVRRLGLCVDDLRLVDLLGIASAESETLLLNSGLLIAAILSAQRLALDEDLRPPLLPAGEDLACGDFGDLRPSELPVIDSR